MKLYDKIYDLGSINESDDIYTINGGDDYCITFNLVSCNNMSTYEAIENIEMIIHVGNCDFVYSIFDEYVEETGIIIKFYLSKEETRHLLYVNPSGYFEFSIHVNWKNGGRNTPIENQILIIKEC